MTDLFLDTDVILDFLGDRRPFSRFAARIFKDAHAGKFQLFTSANSINTAYYILCKSVEDKKSRLLISELLEFIKVIPVTDRILNHALKSHFTDFEDAVQHESAISVHSIKFIVTRNLRDYKKGRIKAIGPEQLFKN